MPTDFNYWRNLITENVKSIADEKHQRYEWFENAKNTWYFPTEMFCQFFDDADARQYFSRSDTGLNESQISAGKHLVDLMEKLSAKYKNKRNDVDALIDDPLMVECRAAAQQLLTALDSH